MRTVVAAIVAGMLAGCGFLHLPAPVPVRVADRPGLPACGTENSQHGETLNVMARQCLLDAFVANRAAEFTMTQLTVEGDPVTRIIRVLADGSVQIFADATQDSFGSGTWQELRCDRLVPVAEWNEHPDQFMPADYVFVEDSCDFVADL